MAHRVRRHFHSANPRHWPHLGRVTGCCTSSSLGQTQAGRTEGGRSECTGICETHRCRLNIDFYTCAQPQKQVQTHARPRTIANFVEKAWTSAARASSSASPCRAGMKSTNFFRPSCGETAGTRRQGVSSELCWLGPWFVFGYWFRVDLCSGQGSQSAGWGLRLRIWSWVRVWKGERVRWWQT